MKAIKKDYTELKKRSGYFKDGINNYIVSGETSAVNPNKTGTKAAANYDIVIKGSQSAFHSTSSDK